MPPLTEDRGKRTPRPAWWLAKRWIGSLSLDAHATTRARLGFTNLPLLRSCCFQRAGTTPLARICPTRMRRSTLPLSCCCCCCCCVSCSQMKKITYSPLPAPPSTRDNITQVRQEIRLAREGARVAACIRASAQWNQQDYVTTRDENKGRNEPRTHFSTGLRSQ